MDTFKLKYPFPSVTVEGKQIDEIKLSRPKAKHLDAMETAREKYGDMRAAIVLVAGVTGLAVKDVEEIDALDFTDISKRAAGFLEASEPDPETAAH